MINSVCGIRSTGRICTDLAEKFESEGHEVRIAYGRENVPEKYEKYAYRIGNGLDARLHGVGTRFFDSHGFCSKGATKKFLKWAEEYSPDLIWLHNLHGYYINVELLFEWIKKHPETEVRWTLHDCWAFTGHCSYFSMAGCEKWREHCGNCPQKKGYPTSFLADNSHNNFDRKRKAFCGVKNMTIITPSRWLAGLVKESFLCEYPVEVQYNKIDTKVFKPTKSDFKARYKIEDKKIILGVASIWDERKGLADFVRLSSMLDEKYVIVLVGVDAQEAEDMPANIIAIERTDSTRELAEIYTAADVFFNPTYEDNYPTTNLEAQSCGTPTVTYRTGGSVESVPQENVVEQGDIRGALKLMLSGELKISQEDFGK